MRKTILLIEDHVADRNMYGNLLWYNGYNVIVAEDGEAGLRLALEQRPNLIILDLQLPLMHGLELNSRLKQDDSTKDIPVIALTGRRLSELGGNAEVLGYARFLEKPVSPLQVLREVEALIGRPNGDQAEDPNRPRVYRTHVPESGEAQQADAPRQATSEEMVQIAARISEDTEPILARWTELVKEEPWFSLPREHRLSNLSEVVLTLVQMTLIAPGDRATCKPAVVAGADHGHNRRVQGIPETLIPIEFHLLRQALWRYLNETFSPGDTSYSAIISLDRGITVTLNAAMWGYYREEIEAHEGWDSAVERLVDTACSDAPRRRRAPAE